MADSRRLRLPAFDRIGDLLDDDAGLHRCDPPASSTLLVWTKDSLYRVVVTQWPEVCVQDGAFVPDPTADHVDAPCTEGSCLGVGWISAGFLVEIRAGGRHIITAPVLAITTEQASRVMVH